MLHASDFEPISIRGRFAFALTCLEVLGERWDIDALSVLRDFLQAAQDRTEAVNDSEAFHRASRALEMCLPLDIAPGFASWFVYGLEKRDFIWHGFRLTDAWITDKGRWLLEAVKRLPPPPKDERTAEPL